MNDIETGELEVDETVVPATNRLFERQPDAQPWIIRIGHRAVYCTKRSRNDYSA